ncbi:unnamed protein product [Phytomonas sp. Hart1]|nr:unnamed protein product [Phytomonas sp. Hart1]|eukprot:CCW68608.1 unnamed protein product [Phytomonas sp. isolate Hart1]
MSLLGSACTIHLGRSPSSKESKTSTATMSGSLLEVRRLWQPYHSHSSSSCTSSTDLPATAHENGPLYAYIRIKEADHRLSGWFPLRQVELKDPSLVLLAQKQQQQRCEPLLANSPNSSECARTLSSFASELITEPILSSIYTQVTAGMARTQRAKKQQNYFEERLLRDGMTPTTIRNFIYLNRFVFRAWYYAPYGILHPEYDPVVPVGVPPSALSSSSALTGEGNKAPVGSPNPYIKDAFLCPFSLRLFTTFEQMCYETRAYRGGRLRPPGVELYRDDRRGFSLFELNGSQHLTYCRHLFCIGKSFLENKLAAHDVQSYFFYVVALHHGHFPRYVDDPEAMYFAGYFTWEKRMAEFNLACILTLPCFSGKGSGSLIPPSSLSSSSPNTAIDGKGVRELGPLKGIGQFMIAVSYELASRRHQVGTPERPFSDLGAAAYSRFWRCRLFGWFRAQLMKTSTHRIANVEEKTDKKDEGKAGGLSKRQRASRKPSSKPAKRRTLKETPIIISNSSSSEAEEEEEEERNAPNHPHGGGMLRVDVSIGEIAREVGLEEADVLDTVLRMGLIHYGAEDRSYSLMIPRSFVEWEIARLEKWESNLHCAVFNSSLLRTKSSTGVGGGRHT